MLELKVTQIFQKLPKTKPKWYFLKNWHTLKQPQKLPHIWATLIRKYVAMNFQKLPNLVSHCMLYTQSTLQFPQWLSLFVSMTRTVINIFLCIAQIGGFAVYILFVSKNFQTVFNSMYGWDLDYRVYLAIIFTPTVLIWYSS